MLAVGDVAFQKKCLGKMGSVAQEGRTVLFVSHHMAAIHQLCPRAIWLDKGFIRADGPASEIIHAYLRDSDQSGGMAQCVFEEDRGKEFQLRRGRLLNEEGVTTRLFSCDESVIIDLLVQVHKPVPGLHGYLSISRMDGVVVMVSDSFDSLPNPLDDLDVGYHVLRITIPRRTLGPGEYAVSLNFSSLMSTAGFHVDSPGTILTFRLDDHRTMWGNARRGYFSTLLEWQVEPVDEFGNKL